MARIFTVIIFLFSSFGLAAKDLGHPASAPIQLTTKSGLSNFYLVTPTLYRSGQPSAEQMGELENIGIKSVLNLRQYHSDTKEMKGTSLKGYHIRMNAGRINDKQMISALRIINEAPKPILVHCWHGSDRTGAVVAMYRIVFEGWSKEAAIEELMQEQYGHHETVYKNIRDYIQQVDTVAIRQKVFNP